MSKEKNPNDSIFKRFGGTLSNAVENLIFAHEEVEEQQAPAEATGGTQAEIMPAAPETPKVDGKLIKAILDSAEELGKVLNEFTGYIKTFENIISDENSRYKAAFAAAAKISPLKVEDLLRAADEQIESLKNEKKDFLAGIKEKSSEVDGLKKEIGGIDAQIETLKGQIKDLEALKRKKEELSINLEENIQKATVRFDAALAVVEQLLREKKTKIERNLKGM